MDLLDQYGLSAAAELADESMLITDAQLDAPGPRIRYVNAAFEALTGYSRDEVVGATPRILQGPGTDRAVLDRLRARLAAGQPFEGNTINYRRDGTPFVMQWRVQPVRDGSDTIVGFVSVQFPVGEANTSVDDGENLHRQVFDQHVLPMLLLDPKTGRIVDANQGAESFYGYAASQLRQMRITDLNELTEAEARAELRRSQSERSSRFVFRHRLANGETRPVEIHSSPITLRGREYLHSVVQDITERDRLADEVQWHLYYDPVTELPNRGLFNDRLAQALRMNDAAQSTSTGMLRIDLDRFRRVNHLVGEELGDRVLHKVGDRLGGQLRPQDTLARTGSDEFSVIMPHVLHRDGVARVAERLFDSLREPFQVSGRSVHLTASIATTLAPADGDSPAELSECADATMLALKRAGGDSWMAHEREHARHTAARMRLAEDLREALSNDRLQLAWQATMDLHQQSPAGGEILVRWAHPIEGWVRADHLVSAAEDSGQIANLGEWVLRQTVRMIAAARERFATPVAVNVSLLQLRSASFVSSVRRVLAETGLAASDLELELTESAFAEESEALIERLRELRSAGVSIAIDDFGTGYSSLQYLRRLPIDRIKIDRSFVAGIDTDPDNEALVSTIVALAERFGLALTAEGIERQAEYDTLRRLGVTKGQGFYFGAPELVGPAADGTEEPSPA